MLEIQRLPTWTVIHSESLRRLLSYSKNVKTLTLSTNSFSQDEGTEIRLALVDLAVSIIEENKCLEELDLLRLTPVPTEGERVIESL